MLLFPITLDHYCTLHGPATDPVLKKNADELLRRVNNLLVLASVDKIVLGIDQISRNHVASGYRPAGVNAKTSNAATASKHLTCQGIDLQDTLDGKRQFAVWCIKNLDALKVCQLWMEDPRWTAGRTNTDPWVHLQSVQPGSGARVYIPYREQVKNPPTDPEFFKRFNLPRGTAPHG